MTNILDNVNLTSSQTTDNDDNFEIPLDLSDILNVCKEYRKLGFQIQNQVECITEMGVEEAIETGMVKAVSLPFIKDFLITICENPLFGQASLESDNCISLIESYELTHPQPQIMRN